MILTFLLCGASKFDNHFLLAYSLSFSLSLLLNSPCPASPSGLLGEEKEGEDCLHHSYWFSSSCVSKNVDNHWINLFQLSIFKCKGPLFRRKQEILLCFSWKHYTKPKGHSKSEVCFYILQKLVMDGGDIRLFITIVKQSKRFLIRWGLWGLLLNLYWLVH